MLLHARDEGGSQMTDQQLRDEVMTLFLAGHETTALALTWAWHLLAQHPAAEQRLLAELAAVLGGRAPAVADLPRLRYADAVVTEAMRLYPPAWVIGRQAAADCEIGGYPVPAGTVVLISPWVMHRHPDYFPEPERFDPDRWTGGLAEQLPAHAYLPFGGGPRLCIGKAFARMEAVLVLATVAQRYRMTPVPGQRVAPDPVVTLRPRHGLKMMLSAR